MKLSILCLLVIDFARSLAGELIESDILNDNSGGWTLSPSESWIRFGQNRNALGGEAVRIRRGASIDRTITTSGYQSISIVIDVEGMRLDDDEYCYVAYRGDESYGWTVQNVLDDSVDSILNYTIDLPDNSLFNDGSFQIKLGTTDDTLRCWFRMLEIYGTCTECEPFEYYTLDDSTGWIEEGDTDYITFGSNNTDLGGLSLHINSEASVSRTISTLGYANMSLVIDVQGRNLEMDEFCYVSYSVDGSSWTIEDIVGETQLDSIESDYMTEMGYTIDLPDSYNDASFEIKIGTEVSDASVACALCNDDCWFRNLEIYGVPQQSLGEEIDYYMLDDSTGWTQSGGASNIDFDVYSSALNGNGVQIDGGASITRTISTSAYQSITIMIDVQGNDLGSSEWCYVSYHPNEVADEDSDLWMTWNIIGDINNDWDSGLDYTLSLPNNLLYIGGSFGIKIGNSGNSADERCWFRELEIWGLPGPTSAPTVDPTIDPTESPTADPTSAPTIDPTTDPIVDPTADPTADPTSKPTVDPTTNPSSFPTKDPTADPTKYPTADPTTDPSSFPTTDPTWDPTKDPTRDGCDYDLEEYLSECYSAEPASNPTTSPTRDGCDFDLDAYLEECYCYVSQSQLPGYNNHYNELRDTYHDLREEYKRLSNYMVMSCVVIFVLISYICVRNKSRVRSNYAFVKAMDSEYYDDDDEVNSSEVPIIQSE